jgi:HEAT repeat protein
MKSHSPTAFAAILAASLWCAGTTFAGQPDVHAAVEKMPAANAQAAREVFETILQGGPPTLLDLCGRLQPPGAGDDHRVRYLLGGLAFHVARPDAAAERDLYARTLLAALEKAEHPDIRSFLMGLLRWCGGEECLAPLAAFLGDPDLTEPATQALLAIRAPGTAEAMLAALRRAEGGPAVTLVKALGELREARAVPLVAPYAAHADAEVRHTALQALADMVPSKARQRTGAGSPRELLRAACRTDDRLEQARNTALLLHHARRLAEAGARADAAALCREIMAQATDPTARGRSHLAPAALHVLAEAVGEGALPDLIAAVEGPDRTISVAALRALISMDRPSARAELDRVLTNGPDHLRLALLATLDDSTGAADFDAIASNLGHENPDVRAAAIRAMTHPRGLPALLAHLKADTTRQLPDIQKAILSIAGPDDMPALADALADAPAPARVLLLDLLGRRRATGSYDAVVALAAAAEPDVRLAALKALGGVATPDQLPKMTRLLLKTTASSEQTALLRSVIRVSKTMPDAERRADALLAVLPSASPQSTEAIVGSLSELGGAAALLAVTAAASGESEMIRNAALKSLADWTDESAAEAMLRAAARTTDLTQQVLLLRGYVRVIRASGLPAEEKLTRYRAALPLAPRPEDKTMILGAVVDLKNLEALRLLGDHLGDPAIREEAASLAVIVACADGDYTGLTDPAARPILSAVLEIVKDEKMRERVTTQITKIE